MTLREAKDLAEQVSRDTHKHYVVVMLCKGNYRCLPTPEPGSTVVARYMDGRMISSNKEIVPGAYKGFLRSV